MQKRERIQETVAAIDFLGFFLIVVDGVAIFGNIIALYFYLY